MAIRMVPFLKPDINKMRDNKDVDGLTRALKHQDILIRINAAYALGDVGDMKGVEPLVGALKDVLGVKMAAATALGDLHDERAIVPLQEMINTSRGIGKTAGVVALARIRGDSPQLIAELENEIVDLPSQIKLIKELGRIHDERAVEPLIKTLDKYRDIHWASMRAMSESERGNILFRVINALGDLGDERAVEPIDKCLNDRIDIVRKAAREALEKIKAPKSDRAGYPPPPPPP